MQTKQIYPQTDETHLISFIVTYYNQPARMLKECLDSILALSLSEEEREIIVVDDGSSLTPVDELLSYRDHIIFVRQPNLGVSEARNTGIRISTGKYLQFIDGDDYLLRSPYEHCLDIMRYGDPEIVLFDMTEDPDEESEYVAEGPIEGNAFMLKHNLRGTACGYLFRRSILSSLRFTKGITYGEDEEFTSQIILRATCLYYTTAKAYYYRQHAASVVHRKEMKAKIARLDDNLTVICHLNQMADTMPKADREALSRRVAQLSMDYIYNVIMLTKSPQHLEKSVQRLSEEGLFPLPDKHFTVKYDVFRKLIKTKQGRRLLCFLLPKLP